MATTLGSLLRGHMKAIELKAVVADSEKLAARMLDVSKRFDDYNLMTLAVQHVQLTEKLRQLEELGEQYVQG